MSSNLPTAPAQYEQRNEQSTRNLIQDQDDQNWKRREAVRPVRLELQDTVTGSFYTLTIVSGVLTLTIVP